MHVNDMNDNMMHANEMHAHKMHANEMHAHKMNAHEMHAHKIHAYEMLTHECQEWLRKQCLAATTESRLMQCCLEMPRGTHTAAVACCCLLLPAGACCCLLVPAGEQATVSHDHEETEVQTVL